MLRLHLFQLVLPVTGPEATSPPPSAAYRRVAMHLGAIPAMLQQAPTFLDNSVDFFRKANATRYRDVSKSLLSPLRTPELNDGASNPIRVKRERWTYGTLSDGLIAVRTRDHPNLEQMDSIRDEIEGAKHLRMRLEPVEKTPYIARRDDGKVWGCFGGPKSPTASDVESVMMELLQWTFCSAMVRELRGVWIRGSAVCDRTTGEAVLFVGGPRCGKTSMALHCLAAHPDVTFVGSTSCFVFVHPLRQQLMVASLPVSPSVRLGTLLGTLASNPCLVPPDLEVASAAAHNSLSTIWHHMNQTHRVPIAEAFGLDKCCSAACTLKSIVMLGWDSHNLEAAAERGMCAVHSDDSPSDVTMFLRESKAFLSHPLLEWGNYAGASDAPHRFLTALESTELPQFHRLGGDVSFGKGTRFVLERVLGKMPRSLSAAYQRGATTDERRQTPAM